MNANLSRAHVWGVLTLALSMGVVTPALARLGSFVPADGYAVQSGDIRGDVSYYNSGAYGANAGGGSGPTTITADSGSWKVIGPAGGYFSNPVDRAAYVAQGVPYSAGFTNALAAYNVGGHSGGRTDNFNLALRNDTPLGTGPMVHEYLLDQYDLGVAPASVTSGPVSMGFYFCPNPGDTLNPSPDGTAGDKFTMSLVDSIGNIGLQWGYLRDNSVVWRDSPTNPWNATSFVADQTNWDGVRINLDLTAAGTFGIDYFDVSANTWSNLVPAGTAMGQSMGEFTVLRWQLEDGLSAGVGGKNFFDDFSFSTVPEPSTALLVALALVGVRSRR
ncbi:hypothetical protein Pla108_02070 [Botrimarina colliarenosi]|uniref:Ice-binding protein C-terminal domain-containing protein n=1 Tax=Botrimarina colliarenosi TaxID=2528001 RepID=A0A5C6AGV7_9BACT|nr:PEP-CTERM sorting domain-containing protein [Botrimarina colliarenosi]TWT99272.1 hypothetical protein Pla108_02070 [Botrimarina colliarenosi]